MNFGLGWFTEAIKESGNIKKNAAECAKNIREVNTHVTDTIAEQRKYAEIPVDYKFSFTNTQPKTPAKCNFILDIKEFQNLDKKITPENFLGGGGEAVVYSLNKDYVIRILDGKKEIKSKNFKPVKDIFEGRNFGQAVLENGEGVTINKRVNGAQIYKCRDYNPETYMQNLREYSELPDETLENFVSDIAFINSKGYRIDQSNPENFLYDRVAKKIGIIDIQPKGSSSLDFFEPYGHDWVMDPLINGHDIFEIYDKLQPKERKEMFELITKLENRVLPLCKKHGIPVSKWQKNDYTPFSVLNVLELKGNIDCNKDILEQIIYNKYPEQIKKYERYLQNEHK